MLTITFNQRKPSQRNYEFSIVGNSKVDIVCFVLQSDLDSVYDLEDLSSFNAFVKIQSAGKEYIDKIAVASVYADEKLTIQFPLVAKTTAYRNLSLQLQFEADSGEIVSQTEIVALSLSGNINADEEIPDKFPSVLTQIEDELDDHEQRIDELEENGGARNIDVSYSNDEITVAIEDKNGEIIADDSATLPFSSKVDKVAGMGLSHNDFTNTEKAKLSGIEDNAQRNVLESVKVNGTALPISNKEVDIDLTPYALDSVMKTYAKSLSVSIDSGTFVISFLLKDSEGNTLSSQSVDLPLESVVVGGRYDSTNKDLILTLKNGQEITIPLDDIISGLVSEQSLATTLQNYCTKAELDTKLTDYAKNDGSYPKMSVGKAEVADNLRPYSENSGVRQTNPFILQSTAGGSDVKYPLCQFESLRGQSYALNQILGLTNSTETANQITKVKSTDGTATFSGTTDAESDFNMTLINSNEARPLNTSHKYLIKFNFKGTTPDWSLIYANQIILEGWNRHLDEDYIGFGRNNTTYMQITIRPTASLDFSIQPQIFDLTLMFGAGNEPTSVEEFNRLFPLPYYAYGSNMVSSQASKLTSVGYNQCNGIFSISENGNYLKSSIIKAIAGQTYSLEKPSFADYQYRHLCVVDESGSVIREIYRSLASDDVIELELNDNEHYLQVRYYYYEANHYTSVPDVQTMNTCLHFTWDGSRTGFEPYEKHDYILPNVETRSAGSVYDEIKPNGEHITRVGTYTFTGEETGTIVNVDSETGFATVSFSVLNGLGKTNGEIQSAVALKGAYASFLYTNAGYCYMAGQYGVYFNLGETDVARTLAKLVGKTIHFELGTPTTEQVASFNENILIDNWGITEYSSVYPQGNSFFYYVDYKAFVDSLGGRQDIGYDASKVVSQTELQSAMSGIDLSDCAKLSTANTFTGTNTFYEIDLASSQSNTIWKIENDQWGEVSFKRNTTDILKLLNNQVWSKTFIPLSNNETLGNSINKWKDIYASGDLDFGGVVKIGGTNRYNLTAWNILPYTHQDLGSSAYPFKDAYIDGKLKDGTNEVAIGNLIPKVIKLDTGIYTSGTAMSQTDYNQLSFLLNLKFEEVANLNLKFIRIDTNRNEIHSTTNVRVRAGGTTLDSNTAWYDITIDFGIGSAITLTPTRLENGTY